MPIERIGRYLEVADLGITPSIGIETAILDDCIEEICQRNIRGVFGFPPFGFKQDNLDFLRRIPFVVQVWFWDIDLKSVDGLYALKNLRYFGVHDRRPPLDFSQFPFLEKIVWQPVKGDKGIESVERTKQLDLWRFKSREKTFSGLSLPKSLERLEINWSNPCDLRSFPCLPRLKQIQFHYCRNLVSLDGIVEAFPSLEEVIITRCPHLSDYNMISKMNLKRVYINIRNKTVASQAMHVTSPAGSEHGR
jgi:hypothetical protein